MSRVTSRESKAVEDYARMTNANEAYAARSWILVPYACPETREYYPKHWRGRRALVHVII